MGSWVSGTVKGPSSPLSFPPPTIAKQKSTGISKENLQKLSQHSPETRVLEVFLKTKAVLFYFFNLLHDENITRFKLECIFKFEILLQKHPAFALFFCGKGEDWRHFPYSNSYLILCGSGSFWIQASN